MFGHYVVDDVLSEVRTVRAIIRFEWLSDRRLVPEAPVAQLDRAAAF